VLLPVAAFANLTPAQAEAILAHEIAHVRRHDFFVNVLQALAETLLFYHPAVWWLSRRIRIEREHCCDDIAVAVCGDPYAYAVALTEIAAAGVSQSPLAVAASGGSLINRVRRLLGVPADSHRPSIGGITILSLAIALIVVAGGVRWFVIAQEPATHADHAGFGPPDLHRLLGLGKTHDRANGDPLDARAWGARIGYGSGEMALIGFTPRSLIREAYSTGDIPIFGAPEWLDTETFEITIHSPGPVASNGRADDAAVREALRSYFETTLNLASHYETREVPVYALVKTGPTPGPYLRPAAGGCGVLCGIDNDMFGLNAKNVTMGQFARTIARDHSPLALGRDVVDRTGLEGAYDFELSIGLLPLAAIAHRSPLAATLLYPVGIRSIHTALPMQLGLKLEESTAPRRVLVIDHIDRPPRSQ
jgi:uncharacterized protein (TIGR03435 family)